MAKNLYDFESHVQGIPCKVRVTYATPYVPASWDAPAIRVDRMSEQRYNGGSINRRSNCNA